MGLALNRLVRDGEISAPIVIGRDHLDAGSVASPNRETESMKDGSDAVGDWAVLNALINTGCRWFMDFIPSRWRCWHGIFTSCGYGCCSRWIRAC